MGWPRYSSDMNSIEFCWDVLDNGNRKEDTQPTTLNDLGQALNEKWASMSQGYINKLIESVPCRLPEVLKSRGVHTNC